MAWTRAGSVEAGGAKSLSELCVVASEAASHASLVYHALSTSGCVFKMVMRIIVTETNMRLAARSRTSLLVAEATTAIRTMHTRVTITTATPCQTDYSTALGVESTPNRNFGIFWKTTD